MRTRGFSGIGRLVPTQFARRRRHGPAGRGLAAVVLAAAACLVAGAPRAQAAEPWRQRSFLVGGFCVARPELVPEDFIAYDAAGLDYVANLEQGQSLPAGLRLLAVLDRIRAERPGFRLGAILYYKSNRDENEEFSGRGLNPARRAALHSLWSSPRGPVTRSTIGLGLWDEPATREELRDAAAMVRFVRASPAGARLIPLVNLFSMAPGGFADYADYLDAWLGQFDGDPDPAPMLCFDEYPFQLDSEGDHFFEHLRTAAARARAHSRPGKRIPLWTVVQVSPFEPEGVPHFLSPDAAQVRWQAWSAVAYGAKGIGFWTLVPVGIPGHGPGWGPGLLDTPGNRTALFEPVRRLDATLHALGPILVQLESVAVFHVAEGVQKGIGDDLLSRTPYRVIADVAGPGREDAMVGYFKRVGAGDDWLLVVNKSLDRTRSFGIRLAAAADSIQRVDPLSGRLRPVATRTSGFDAGPLAPGSAMLFRVASRVVESLPGVTEVRQEGAITYYRMPRGILRVDARTQDRRWVSRAGGSVSSRLVATPRGVVRR